MHRLSLSVVRGLVALTLSLAGLNAWALKCDVDNNGRIDRTDVNLITQAYIARSPVTGPDDPRDPDNSLTITSADARICLLRCTYANCASNGAPVANAGPDQTARVGVTVTLSGAASSDPDGNPITYRWAFTARPVGSAAALAGANTVSPSFVVDKPGSYTAQLIVNDGTVDSAADTIVVNTVNTPPVANAGPDQAGRVGDTIALSGAASSDADGNPLSYRWAFTVRPGGSTAALSGANTVNPSFVIDKPGSYTVQLIVNDGSADSVADTVVVDTTNSPPVAHAGPDQTARVGATVNLTGAASSDPDGNLLSYRWAFTARPATSAAALSGADTVSPSFIVDKPGSYTVQLIVNDGSVDSVADTVVINTLNSAPVANAGPDQSGRVGDTITLDGRLSNDVDGDALSYAWRLVSAPAGSSAALNNANIAQPQFTIDVAGTYEFELVVGDGSLASAPDRVLVSTLNSPPVAKPGNNRSVTLGATVTLDGSASFDVDGNPLSYRWSLTARPAGSAAALSAPNSVNPSFVADRPGSYVVQLIVNDGLVDSAAASVTISTDNAAPTANAGPDQSVPLGATVQLNGEASPEPESAPLNYVWSLTTKPAGSTATLAGANTATPSFVADKAGNYIAQLIVNDGTLPSAPDTVVVSTLNSRPVANAGAPQAVNTGSTVQLDGSASNDADGDTLSYAWSFTTRPAGSAAVISPANAAQPSFVADLPGTYVAQLIVSDASLASVPATVTVTVTTPNRLPVAAAAATPTTVNVGSAVSLSSAGSGDPDGNPITYAWTVAARPAGSNATIVAPTAADTSFTPDVAGQYTLLLTVSDGSLSASAQAVVTANAVAATHPPVIVSVAGTVASIGAPYVYDVDATDVDAGDVLTYSLTTAPAGMLINPATGVITWTPSPAQTGAQSVTVRVADQTNLFATQSFVIHVGAAPTPLQLAATLAPATANAGETVTLVVVVSGGNGGPVTRTATLDGVALPLDASGIVSFAAPAPGVHKVQVTATGSAVNGQTPAPQSRELLLSVRDPADTTAPVAAITSPTADSEVLAPINVNGTASDARLAYYQLLVKPAGAADTAWVEIWRGTTSVTNNVLGRLDPSRFANGVYELGLNVVDVNGRTTSVKLPFEIARDRKLGAFRISFTDIRAEAAGLPLTLNRTYDSLKKDQIGDFGWGWSADATDVSVRKNMVLGLSWQLQTQGFNQCVRPIGNRRVTVTLPDGGVYRFQASNNPVCAFAVPPAINIQFDALPLPVGGSAGAAAGSGTLEVTNLPSLVEFRGGVLFDWDALDTWNPTDFIFTSAEGAKYTLREGVGVISMTDRYGNTVNYGPGGYQHNSALAVTFTRDPQGRITRATDPAGKFITYAYNAAGELASMTDRLGQVTYFLYDTATEAQGAGDSGSTNSAHLLATIIDPRGVAVARQQFDQFGRVASLTDGAGATATQTFDEATNLQRVVDRRGNPTSYTFDNAGNITRIVDALGGVTDLTYDANGNELTRRNPLGQTVTKTFNAVTGKVLTQTDALGRTTTTAYPTTGRDFERQNPTSVTDPLGRVTSYAYAPAAATVPNAVPTSITEPLGRVTTIGLDTKGNLTALNVGGIALSFTYDAKGRRTRETDALGNAVNYTFDANGNVLTRTVTRTVGGVPRTETTTRAYDTENRLIQETDATGAVRSMVYNSMGQLDSTTDALGRVTRHAYDGAGRLVRTDWPDGSSEQWGYDANGNRTSAVDRLGRVTRMVYDELNRLVRTEYPDGTTAQREYDAAGRLTAEIDGAGARRASGFDAGGQLTSLTDASGRRTEHVYDAAGNRTQTRLPDGRVINHTYDALNRLTRTDLPGGAVQSATYRTDGRKATETDERGVTTTFGYDAAGRLVSAQQSGVGAATVFGYDETGINNDQRDAAGRQTRWRHDAAGRPVSRTLPDGSQETFSYDAEGRLTSATTFGGQVITRIYDALGREISRTVPATATAPARTTTWTYTPNGLRATQTETGAASSEGVITYTYDELDRLIQLSGPQGTLRWTYDASGRVSRRTTAEGSTDYEYDGDGRLTRMVAPDARATVYTYDASGRLVRSEQELDAAGLVLQTDRKLDARNRPTSIAHSRRQAGTLTLLSGQAITRSATGAVTRLDTFDGAAAYDVASGQFTGPPVRVQTFGYDANSRLAQENEYTGAQLTAWLANPASPASQAVTYVHDDVGNRTSKVVVTPSGTESSAYAYDNNDRLVSETLTTTTGSTVVTSFTWDANGNMTGRQSPSEYVGQTFDAENRLVEVRRGPTPATAAVVASYGYDADGQRVRQTGAAGTTHFLIDPVGTWPQVVLESTGQQRVAYIWGDALRQQFTGLAGSLFANPAQALVPVQGHGGSTLALLSPAAAVLETEQSNAWGVPANPLPLAPHQFTGEYWDRSARLIYLRDRWYAPEIGRFISADRARGQLANPRTLHRYAYAGSDPVNRRDPSGLMEMSLGGFSVGFSISSTLANASAAGAGILLASILYPYADSAARSTIWDLMVLMSVSATVPDAAYDAMAAAAAKAEPKTHKPPERHHTIPQYLCGSGDQQLALVTYSEHSQLHAGLALVSVGIEAAGTLAADKLNIPFGRRRSSTVEALGRSELGRGAIAKAIEAFYVLTPAGGFGGGAVLTVFGVEKPLFVGGKTWCR